MKLKQLFEQETKNKQFKTSTWKDFLIPKLFDIQLSKGDNQAKKLKDGEIPLVSAGNFNNGICKYVDKGDGVSEIFSKNTITVDMFGKSFYQDKDYYAVSHGRVNMLIPKFTLSKSIGLFLVAVLDATFRQQYSFSTMCSQSALNKEIIKLPSKNGEPDWKFMEEYIEKNLQLFKITNFNKVIKKIENVNSINLSRWKEFSLCGDKGVFDLKNSISKIHNKDIKGDDGEIPYVTRTDKNNGVARYISKQDININQGKCLSLGMDAVTIFYQDKDFYTGDKIKILRNDKLNKFNSLFLISVIKKVIKQEFSWGGKSLNFKELPKLKIKLPEKNNEPDWQYMEDYMRNLVKDIKGSLVV